MTKLEIIDNFDGEFAFLSNFFLEKDGLTLEHRFQAAKALIPGEGDWVLGMETPGRAKRAGRKVCLRPDWEEVKFIIMKDLLLKKFQYEDLKLQLLKTGAAKLIEGNNWHDNIWGSCRCEKCGNKGKNMLGKLLMEVREELR